MMGEFGSIDEILEFAIAREVEANEFYKALADYVKSPAMRELISEFAKEELEHKAKLKLELMKIGRTVAEAGKDAKVKGLADFKKTNYMTDVGSWSDMDYRDLLVLAMKKEKVSFRLYADLATIIDDEDSREVLLSLAEEEARHKVLFEIEYDEITLKEKR
jgi:rubrerythrin